MDRLSTGSRKTWESHNTHHTHAHHGEYRVVCLCTMYSRHDPDLDGWDSKIDASEGRQAMDRRRLLFDRMVVLLPTLIEGYGAFRPNLTLIQPWSECLDQEYDGVVDHFEKVKGEREGSSTVGVGPGQCWENDDLKKIQG